MAYNNRNLTEFNNLLHRTGYKPATTVDQTVNLLNSLGLRKFKTSRNLLFERENFKKSLFEKILQTPGFNNCKFIKLIWNECELWRSSDDLTELSPKGLLPIDYIIESQDDRNLLAFLVFDFDEECDTVSHINKKYFLILKNKQYKEKTGQTLFQKFYSVQDQQNKPICLSIMEKLLKEMKQIDDIKVETSIDEVLEIGDEIYRNGMFNLLMTYWPMNSRDYDQYKAILSDISPYYKLIFMLKERDESEFEKLFQEYLDTMKQKHGDQIASIVQNDCNSLLEFALNYGQCKAIDIMINCDLVDANKVVVNSDLSTMESKDAHFFMARLLEKGYYVGNRGNTSDWITSQVLNDFLDSRVSENGELFLECLLGTIHSISSRWA